jgi:pantoate--beta-alanine ligase
MIHRTALAREGASVALVPTMGFLHAGHLSLLDRGLGVADAVVMSVFVNPLQFGPGEDFERYPRDLGRDLELAAERSVRLVFAPPDEEMYPGGPPLVRVSPGAMGDGLCGAFRPGHFEGVLTVVMKLFALVRPDVAVFGRKDLQQSALIRRMADDFDLGIRIEVGPVVREEDGVAMSSRNAYLSPEERERARGLFRALTAADDAFRRGEAGRGPLIGIVQEVIRDHPGLELQYVDVVDGDTLRPMERAKEGAVLAVAGFAGRTRLIDNVVLGAEEPDPRMPGPARMEGRA